MHQSLNSAVALPATCDESLRYPVCHSLPPHQSSRLTAVFFISTVTPVMLDTRYLRHLPWLTNITTGASSPGTLFFFLQTQRHPTTTTGNNNTFIVNKHLLFIRRKEFFEGFIDSSTRTSGDISRRLTTRDGCSVVAGTPALPHVAQHCETLLVGDRICTLRHAVEKRALHDAKADLLETRLISHGGHSAGWACARKGRRNRLGGAPGTLEGRRDDGCYAHVRANLGCETCSDRARLLLAACIECDVAPTLDAPHRVV